MLKIALLFTEASRSTKDLGEMITHLSKVLKGVTNVQVNELELSSKSFAPFDQYDYLVFCGYDHVTLANIHMALASESEEETKRIFLFDEPGASINMQLSSLIFQGIDYRRIPPSSASRLISCWSYRDIVGVARADVVKLDNGPKTPESASDTGDAKPTTGRGQRANRARQVETQRKAPTRKGDETTLASGGAPSKQPTRAPE